MRNRLLSLALALAMLVIMVAPAFAQSPSGDFEVIRKAADAYLNSGKAYVMTAEALFMNLNDGDKSNDPFILSVRSAEHYALGHIPGAINIPYKTIAKPENLAKLPKDKQILVYCYTGHTGQIATTILNLLGYNAVNLKFGMMGWTKNDEVLATKRFTPDNESFDYALETTVNQATATFPYPTVSTGASGDFEIIRTAADNWLNTVAAPIVGAAAIFTNLNDGDASNNPFIVSVRSAEHYALGHVPGAIQITLKDFAKAENLAKLPNDKRVVLYCYTGHTGQVATTIAGLLGYDAGNMKYGMMGWTKNDTILATARYDVTKAPDYATEGSATAPSTLPTTGAETNLTWVVLVAGIAALFAGSALYAKRATR
jgi:LPXTG-motif cell wall-anchored protein